MNLSKFFLTGVLLLALTGCSAITLPTPDYVLKRPIGTDSVKIGMSKDKVRELWGVPDQINEVEDKERWGSKRTEWIYNARTELPIDAGYLSKTKRLYFDGENLTNITEE